MLTERSLGVLHYLGSFSAPKPQPKSPYLRADLGRNADKLRVGREGRQVLHGFDQGGGGNATLIAVVFREIPIQGLMGHNTEALPH